MRVPSTAPLSHSRSQRAGLSSRPSKTNPLKPISSADRLSFLQRTIGNRAVRRLFECGSTLEGIQRTELSRRPTRIQRAPSPKLFHCPDFAGDAKLEACLNDRDRLRPGDEGPSVQKVQRGLLNDDIFIGPEGADGKFGPNTAQGVMAFKAKHHLGSTEFPDVGPGTMGKLDELCGGGASASGVQVHRPLWKRTAGFCVWSAWLSMQSQCLRRRNTVRYPRSQSQRCRVPAFPRGLASD